MKYQGLIFDLDGTLIDSMRDIIDSWNQAFGICGLPIIHPDKLTEAIKHGKDAVLDTVVPRAAPKNDRDAIITVYKECYRQNWNRYTRVFPGVNELLAKIHKRGIKCAVLSNKSQDMTDLCCNTFLAAEVFSVICGVSEDSLPKPSPVQALKIGREFGFPSSQIAMIGDTGIDIQTAFNAGFGAILCTWGGHCYHFTDTISPDIIFNKPQSILDYINHHS